MNASPITLDTQGLVAFVSFFIPLVVAALTKKESKSWEKQATSVSLNALLTFFVLIFQATGHITFYVIVLTFGNSLIASLGSYKALLNLGATNAVATVAAPGLGVGSAPQYATVADPSIYDTPTTENQVSNMKEPEVVPAKLTVKRPVIQKTPAKKAAPRKRTR